MIDANIYFTNNYLFRVAVTRTGLYKGFVIFISVKTCFTSYLMNFAFFYGGPSYLKAFWWPPMLEMASHGATCNVFVSAFTGNSAHQVICSSKLKTLKPGKFSQLSFITITAWLKSAHREKNCLTFQLYRGGAVVPNYILDQMLLLLLGKLPLPLAGIRPETCPSSFRNIFHHWNN